MRNSKAVRGLDPDRCKARWRAHRADDDADGLGNPSWIRNRRWPGGGAPTGGDDAPEGDESDATPFLEEPVEFDSLPKVVREAVIGQCPGAGGFDAIRLSQGEATCFNVVARRGRIEMSVTVSPAGEVMEFELDVSPSRLPKAVRATIEREYDNVDFDRITTVTMHFYELQYEGEDGSRRVVQVDATGKVLADQEDEGEEPPPLGE